MRALILLLDVNIEGFLVPVVGNYQRYADGGWGNLTSQVVVLIGWLEETYFLVLPLTHGSKRDAK